MKKAKILAVLAAIFFSAGVGNGPVTAAAAGTSNSPAVSDTVIEFKEVTHTNLYRSTGEGEAEKIEELDISDGVPENVDDYYAVIQMKHLPDYYAGIKGFEVSEDSEEVTVMIDQEAVVQYGEKGTGRKSGFSFTVPTTTNQQESAASKFFDKMSKDLDGTYELTEDLDASGLADAAAAVKGTFTGTLDGKGHRIKNLDRPLFEVLKGAKIKNLVIGNATITKNSKGILAGQILNQSQITSTYIVDSSLINNQNQIGGFAGVITNSTVSNSAAINITIKGSNTIGGIAGQTNGTTKIENCYVTGTLEGTLSHNLGTRVGGITGWHSGKAIDHCFTKVSITAPAKKGNGGIIGGPGSGQVTIENSLSLSTGTAYRIAGFDTLNKAQSVYEYTESDSATNINDNNTVKETSNIYNKDFYIETLGFSEDIWNFDLLGNEILPSLKDDPVPKKIDEYEIHDNENEIPNYKEVRKNSAYQANKEIAYANMAKLMPFADTAYWVESGNKIDSYDALAFRKIKMILPLGDGNSLVSSVTESEEGVIKKLRVIYDNDQTEDIAVQFEKEVGGVVAQYKAANRGVSYQFEKYITRIDAEMLDEVVEKAESLDYAKQISLLTDEEESRLYTDYYNDTVKPNLEEVLLKWIGAGDEFPTYCTQEGVKEQVKAALLNEDNLKRFLYGYNYIDKWYHIEFGGVVLSDVLYFNGTVFSEDFTADYLTEKVLSVGQGLRATNRTQDFYSNVLQSETGKGMMDFLTWMAERVARYVDANDWMKDNFDGILKEQDRDQSDGTTRYRIWDIMEGLSGRMNHILPILTAPQEDMYMISMPSQLMIGSLNRYPEYHQANGRQKMEEIIDAYAARMGHFYGVSGNLVPDSSDILNGFVNIQYDTRFSFPKSDGITAGTQEPGKTNDPVMKWVYEAVNSWPAGNGSGAYANGTNVWWAVYAALKNDLSTTTHETAHNQDGRYFYAGAGRRAGTGGEAHADGNIAQDIVDGSTVFNMSTEKDMNSDVTNNFSYTRIDTPEKIQDYYKDMFDTMYVLEYMAGQAFLELTPEQQAKVAVQVTYTGKDGTSLKANNKRLTAADFEKMNLQDMDDLWDNQIAIKETGAQASAKGGAYGWESFYDSNWYQIHNDEGSGTAKSFRRLGQEMLGVAGYMDGYVTFMSGKSENDLDALRKITNDPSITWKDYKMKRYQEVAENLEKIPYFDSDEVIEQFKEALAQDAKNGNRNQTNGVKRLLYGTVKRATNDFTNGTIYEAPQQTSITSAQQLVDLAEANEFGNYRLDEDIDFSEIQAKDGYYIEKRFIGILDGNGHKITGMNSTLFKESAYAQISDLTIENPNFGDSVTSMLVGTARNFSVRNITALETGKELPLVTTKKGTYKEYGTIDIQIGRIKINTVEQFLAIGTDAESLAGSYVLAADLDFSGEEISNVAVNGTFTGELDGAGHKIVNLSGVVFSNLSEATVTNLGIDGGNITGDAQRGKLANKIDRSTIEKVYLGNFSIQNNAAQVGGLAGIITGSTIKEVSLENISIKGRDTIGGLGGQVNSTTIENCLVTGTLEGTSTNKSAGARVGGLVGWLDGSSSLDKCYAKADIKAPNLVGNGGLVGGQRYGTVKITNSLSMSTGEKAYRVAGFDTLAGSSNVYEHAGSDSVTNVKADSKVVKLADDAMLKMPQYYTTNLLWRKTVWNLDAVSTGGTPRLQGALITPYDNNIAVYSIQEPEGDESTVQDENLTVQPEDQTEEAVVPETSQIVPETPSVEMPPIQTPSTEPEQVGGTETETETGVELETGIDQSGDTLEKKTNP